MQSWPKAKAARDTAVCLQQLFCEWPQIRYLFLWLLDMFFLSNYPVTIKTGNGSQKDTEDWIHREARLSRSYGRSLEVRIRNNLGSRTRQLSCNSLCCTCSVDNQGCQSRTFHKYEAIFDQNANGMSTPTLMPGSPPTSKRVNIKKNW